MKFNSIGLTAALFTLISGTAQAAISHSGPDFHGSCQKLKGARQQSCNLQHYARPSSNGHGGSYGNSGSSSSLPLTTVNCGDVITQSIRLANDLNCPDTTGFGFTISGDNVNVDGNGHTVYAPLAVAAVFVQGNNDSLTNLKENGTTNGYGLFVYDSPSFSVTKSQFNGNSMGIVLYAENTTMNSLEVTNNQIDNNSVFGVRTGQDGNGSIIDPKIGGNTIRNSGYFAMSLQATHDTLGDCEQNDLSGSLNGIDLKDGIFYLHDLDLSGYKIPHTAIFSDSAISIQISNVNVSSHLAPQSSQENMGVDLYRVGSFTISGLTCNGNDVGLKLETESGISPTGKVSSCTFSNNAFAGIMITSYDGTPYGVLDLSQTSNHFSEGSNAYPIFTSNGTTWSQPAPTSPSRGSSCGRW